MSEHFGKLLKRIRLDSGYDSLGELSRMSGISVATLSRIESGVQHPSPATLERIASCLPNTTYENLMVAAGYLADRTSPDPRAPRKTYDNTMPPGGLLHEGSTVYSEAPGNAHSLSPEARREENDQADLPDVRRISRAAKKMNPEQRKQWLKMAEILFPEAFKKK